MATLFAQAARTSSSCEPTGSAHSMFDPERYRDKAEVEQWMERDPIALMRRELEASGHLAPDRWSALQEEVGADEPPGLDCGDGQVDLVPGTVVDCVLTDPASGTQYDAQVTITRAEVTQETVSYEYMLDDETGYVAIRDFARSTGREVAEALKRLKGEGMKRLVLDLRNNGGGLLDQAIEVADQFVPGESKIVETRGRIRSSYST